MARHLRRGRHLGGRGLRASCRLQELPARLGRIPLDGKRRHGPIGDRLLGALLGPGRRPGPAHRGRERAPGSLRRRGRQLRAGSGGGARRTTGTQLRAPPGERRPRPWRRRPGAALVLGVRRPALPPVPLRPVARRRRHLLGAGPGEPGPGGQQPVGARGRRRRHRPPAVPAPLRRRAGRRRPCPLDRRWGHVRQQRHRPPADGRPHLRQRPAGHRPSQVDALCRLQRQPPGPARCLLPKLDGRRAVGSGGAAQRSLRRRRLPARGRRGSRGPYRRRLLRALAGERRRGGLDPLGGATPASARSRPTPKTLRSGASRCPTSPAPAGLFVVSPTAAERTG